MKKDDKIALSFIIFGIVIFCIFLIIPNSNQIQSAQMLNRSNLIDVKESIINQAKEIEKLNNPDWIQCNLPYPDGEDLSKIEDLSTKNLMKKITFEFVKSRGEYPLCNALSGYDAVNNYLHNMSDSKKYKIIHIGSCPAQMYGDFWIIHTSYMVNNKKLQLRLAIDSSKVINISKKSDMELFMLGQILNKKEFL